MSQTRLLWLLATLIAVPAAAQGGTACLQGRVYGPVGSPLMGARVRLLNTGAVVATDIEGRFAFLSLTPDTVSVRVTYIGHKSGQVSGLRLSADKTVTQDFTLEESQVTVRPMGDVPPPASPAREPQPQPPTPIVLERTCPGNAPSSQPQVRMIDGVPVDNSGRVLQVVKVFESPQLGSNPSQRNTYVDGVPVQTSRQPLSGTACLQGRVFSGRGGPLAGAMVVLQNPRITTITDARGQYAFWSLAPDTVSLRVSSIGYKAAVVSGLRLSPDRIMSQDFTLEQSAVAVTQVTPAPGMVGRQASATPMARPADASLCEASPTKLEVMRLPDGSYVDKLPVDSISRVSTGNAPGTYTPGPVPGRLEGTVMAIGRQPLWGATVFIVGSRVSVNTDTTGRYRFDFVPAGAITLLVQVAGSNSARVEGIRIEAGKTVTQDIVLEPATPGGNGLNRGAGTQPEFVYADALPPGVRPDSNPGRIEGTIRDASNRAVADARVVIIGTMESARTDSAGRYVLPLVRSGMLTLRATRDGYAMVQAEGLRLNRGQTIVQDFQLVPVPPGRP